MKIKNLFRNLNYPIEFFDRNGNQIYYEDSNGYWLKREFNQNGNQIYYEDSNGYWLKREFNQNGNQIYYEDSNGY